MWPYPPRPHPYPYLHRRGGVYHFLGDNELSDVQAEALNLYNSTNALYPGIFPSIRKVVKESERARE
jgi:hypothetical protein